MKIKISVRIYVSVLVKIDPGFQPKFVFGFLILFGRSYPELAVCVGCCCCACAAAAALRWCAAAAAAALDPDRPGWERRASHMAAALRASWNAENADGGNCGNGIPFLSSILSGFFVSSATDNRTENLGVNIEIDRVLCFSILGHTS